MDEYLRISHDTELRQRTMLVAFVLAANSFPQWMQDSMADLAENYQSRASAFHDVVAADVAGNDDAWRAAADEYYSHSAPEAVFPIIEDLLSKPELTAAFAADGVDSDDLIEAMKVAFGVG